MVMAATAAVMAGTSLYSGIAGAKAAAKEADRRRENEMAAANQKFSATQDSINIMKAAGRESLYNATGEALRAGAENNRQVRQEVDKAVSTSKASSEGLTSGRSKGREMMTLSVKGAKAVNDSKSQTSDYISKMTAEQDANTNKLNNDLLSAHQELSSVLSTPGATYEQNVAGLASNTLSSGMSGASIGMSLENSISSGTAVNTTTSTGVIT